MFWGSLDDARLRRVVPSTTMGTFVEPDQLLIVRDGVLEAQRLRMADLQPVGDARPLLGQMRVASDLDSQAAPVSATRGLLVYSPLSPQRTRLVEFDRAGRRLRTIGEPGHDDSPAVDPSGKRIIVRRNDPASGTSNLWLYEGTAAWCCSWNRDGPVGPIRSCRSRGKRSPRPWTEPGRRSLPTDGSLPSCPTLLESQWYRLRRSPAQAGPASFRIQEC